MAPLNQTPARKTPLASLTEATSAISRAHSLADVIAMIRASARTLIGCEGITIVRREGDLCHYVEEDAIGPLWKGQTFPEVACISGWSMINRQTVVVPDISVDERIPHELYAETFVRAVAMSPIKKASPVGAIGAYWSKPYEPTQWEIETLDALAEAAATAIEHMEFNSGLRLSAAGVEEPSADEFRRDIDVIASIAAVPTMLDVVLRLTGMGFAAIARVTETRWITCSVLDHVGFGLKPGDELPVESTLCNEIRDHRQIVVFDDAVADAKYCDHHTPRIYGLRGYISMPIILKNGSFWGTLCAIDANPANVNNPQVIGTFKLFAELIAHHLDAFERLEAAQTSLQHERELSELREQFIAVLGHDLRNPLAALNAGTNRLIKEGWSERSPLVLNLMKASISRMAGLVDNVMDLARARMGGGIALALADCDLAETLAHVVEEVRVAHPDRDISVTLNLQERVSVDAPRIAQMISNLLSNAVMHGDALLPIQVEAMLNNGILEIAVRNGGRPIPPEMIAKLFLPFKRGEDRPGVQGLGLGLYIASQIAQAHGGRIDVCSSGNETCFTFKMSPAA
ncbi:GAF domain-containing sensor histidine kinase [Agrobacterium larrymoorei]|uniref:histidine kinase n=1 Tax=Agrobacterium larrymoorei TaxID=160699 RepID=A0A4D7DYE9_9HYPH|nr:GAF domain-containing sensor histidine kinase [Agrobacterium larrymoorei]QCJ00255.1 sensor histidine kinase [Agrobacterium larrymoorei]QYA09303.1 GAF domain-containing sensor histidine kinase [Agrobacterium larrymoorei]